MHRPLARAAVVLALLACVFTLHHAEAPHSSPRAHPTVSDEARPALAIDGEDAGAHPADRDLCPDGITLGSSPVVRDPYSSQNAALPPYENAADPVVDPRIRPSGRAIMLMGCVRRT